MLKTTKRFIMLSLFISANYAFVNAAISMEDHGRIGERTIDKNPEGETFISGNDRRIFLISDINDPTKYATYLTDQGNHLTVQEVPGDGRCGDYAMGISRDEFKQKIEAALKCNDVLVQEFVTFVPVLEDLDGYKFLEMYPDLHLNAHQDGIRSTLQLAAYLFKLNLEIYYPNYSSYGKEISYGLNPLNFKPINQLKLNFSALYGEPLAPVIRLLHMGHLEGFRLSGNKHYRYLFEQENLKPWEQNKVELLELAIKEKYAMDPSQKRGDKAPYEVTCEKIIRVQAEGIKDNFQKEPARATQDYSKDIDLAAATIAHFVNSGVDEESMVRELRNSGFAPSIFAAAIAQAKEFHADLVKYAKELNITQSDFESSANAVSMSYQEYYSMMK